MSVAPDRVNILLVDDQPEGLVALDAILTPLGQNLVRASSGREALRQLLRQDFALILLDVVMPDIDGFETAKLIREHPRSKNTPIIFLTGLSRGEMPAFQAYSLGAVDYILKPFDPDVLRSKVNVFVELARKTELLRQQAEALREAERREHERQLEEERSRAREALLQRELEIGQQERRWLEAVLNAMPTPLVLLEPGSAKPLFSNRAAQGWPWSGIESDVQFSDRQREPLATDQLPAVRAAAGEKLDGEHFRWKHGTREGSFLAYSELLPQQSGHDATVLMTMLDVTQLTIVEESLKAAVQARDTFLSVASHELKTPLTTLGLQIQRLIRAQRRGEELLSSTTGRDHVALLDRAIGRLNKLVSDLLDVSRISAGKLEIVPEEVDLSEIVRDVTTQMKEELALAKCPLQLSADQALVGWWDRGRLEQVVTNLLANAMKYAAGKPIDVAVFDDDGTATLVVRDQGIGIAAEDQPRIFQRFERAASEREYGGLGLGLWIVQQIVRNFGGEITVQSALGQGSTFTVRLPRRAAAFSSPGDSSHEPLAATA